MNVEKTQEDPELTQREELGRVVLELISVLSEQKAKSELLSAFVAFGEFPVVVAADEIRNPVELQ